MTGEGAAIGRDAEGHTSQSQVPLQDEAPTTHTVAICRCVACTLAGGGKVQGDNGAGTVSQNGPCPFGVGTPP